MATITAHCVVKNEENFVAYAIRSVINFVERVMVFDTGSTDKTVDKIMELVQEYPGKIIFEQKGECDATRHTELRQEMVERTKTDWFMILDGDEVWTNKGMQEVVEIIKENNTIGCLLAPYYLCVGDIFHYSLRGKNFYENLKIHALVRFYKISNGTRWNLGPYGKGDYVVDDKGSVVREGNYYSLSNKYWHATSLERSSKDNDIILGRHKQVMTYSLKIIGEGYRIREPVPEVFKDLKKMKLPLYKSWVNLVLLFGFKTGLLKNRIWI